MELVDNLPDFEKYYTGTFIGKRVRGGLKAVSVRGVAANRNTAILREDGHSMEVPFATLLENYSLSPPNLGMINVGDSVCYAEIIPLRQVKKGLHLTRITKKDFGGRAIDIQSLAEAAYAPEYFSFTQSLDSVTAGERRAAAFSPFFCLESVEGAEFPVLYYRTHVMGEVQGKEIIISPAYKEYEDRLRKYLPKSVRITQWKLDNSSKSRM